VADSYFSKELFKFLADLRKNNNREWFNANKDRYERWVKEPSLDFISDAGRELRKISQHIVADPRPVGGSFFRIHRDIRFAKDKSPYKTNVGIHFRHSAGKDVHAPGIYLHLNSGECFMGGGMWMPETAALTEIRSRIVDKPAEWKKVLRSKPRLSDEEMLVRPPKGIDPNHEHIKDLKRKSFIASVSLTDAQVTDQKFMSTFIGGCKSVAPLMAFLAAALDVPW
jgi:uncharacterized protein (TIGR02453 family)